MSRCIGAGILHEHMEDVKCNTSQGEQRSFAANDKRRRFLIGCGAVRPVKLDFFDHPFTCPLCKEHIVYTSMHTVIADSRRKCPSCQGELLINEGTVTAAISDKKAPKRVGLATAKHSRK